MTAPASIDTTAGAREPASAPSLGGPLPWIVAGLALQRLVYHLVYLRDVPFAVATISDGRIYEQAAADLVAHPPLGSAPFYLQGLYAMQLAVPMAVGGLALALLVQLAIAGASWWLLHRAMRSMFGARVAAWGLVLALAHPPLAFYENKFLSASLTVTCCIGIVAAMGWFERRLAALPAFTVGVCAALTVLARPNLLLAVPCLAIAVVWPLRSGRWLRVLGAFVLGTTLVLGAMAGRNAAVTGTPTFFPAHGGGTSFYIGNNARANGVWNAAGLFTGDVARESEEYAGEDRTGDAAEIAAMGDELYRRAWEEIAADPMRWVRLLGRKAWLMLGNDELAQDYDVLGEREMIPWANRVAVPFGVLLALAIVGAATWWRAPEGRLRLFWVLGLGAATVAGNLVFFTSSQHRLPLAIPLVLLAASGVRWLVDIARDREALRTHRWLLVLAALALAQSFWPRSRQREPSAVHYYNLALAFDHVGEPTAAAVALDRALQRAPDQPLMLMERAVLRRRAGDADGAQADLDRVLATPGIPDWVHDRAVLELESVAWVREDARARARQ